MDLPKPLKCSEVGKPDVLEALIAHKLSPEDEDRVLAHLKTCPDCLSIMAVVLFDSKFKESGQTI